MIEIRKVISGVLVDRGKLDIAQAVLDECVSEISNARGRLGEYRIRVQWLSEADLIAEREKAKKETTPND